MKVVLIIGVTLLLGAFAVVGFLTWGTASVLSNGGVSKLVKESPPYHAAAQQISLDPDVLNALGQPLEFGEAAIKSHSGDDDRGSVVLDIQVKGPNGAGHAQVQIAKSGPGQPWMSKGGDFFPAAGGRPIRLLAH